MFLSDISVSENCIDPDFEKMLKGEHSAIHLTFIKL